MKIKRSVMCPEHSQKVIYDKLKTEIKDLVDRLGIKGSSIDFLDDRFEAKLQSKKFNCVFKAHENALDFEGVISTWLVERKKVNEQVGYWIQSFFSSEYEF